jgi:xanthine dehydrogenase YagR molybdenum-binding subunit
MDQRRVMGKRTSRIDGPVKASGRAKYSSDKNLPGMLFGAILGCPHAHARVSSIDTGEAEKTRGVTAVRVMAPAGTEIQWAGWEVASLAATSEDIARDAMRKIKVSYEVLPHVVREEDLSKAGSRSKPAGEQITGDVDKAFADADAISEGEYGIPVITHITGEPHGCTVMWKGDQIDLYPSTQALTDIGPELARGLKVPATEIHSMQDHIGGAFGSKFSIDKWGIEAAELSKASGGRPVKMFLDRATDEMIAGNRPSHFARIKIGGKNDGTITAWQSQSWSTGGFGGGGMAPIPYVFTNIPNRRLNHTAVSLNAGGQRAWRAPNHPQASFLTVSAMEDFAAKLSMDPMQVFEKNFQYTARGEVYSRQLKKAAELANWSKLWHPRGQSGPGTVKRGLGIGICTWGGAGHASKANAIINPDGSVEIELGSQDLGTGTRTIIAMVAAETLGLTVPAIRVKIGDNRYPPSGSSGGSTTVGGVSTSTRKATVNALAKLFEKVAPSLGAQPDQLEAVNGAIRVKGTPAKALSWKAACQKLGTTKILETGENVPREAPKEGLNTGGVAGIQIADVSVDVETGLVKLNKLVVVQDCGLIINPKTAESQCFGAATMSICSALLQERIMCSGTGRVMNPNYEFDKLSGIGDVGEIVVYLDIDPEHDKRGVIGLGEPPVVGGPGAIANAVANAIGVRVPMVPLTARRVLDALGRGSA